MKAVYRHRNMTKNNTLQILQLNVYLTGILLRTVMVQIISEHTQDTRTNNKPSTD